jgi:hypothetical protein
MKKLIALLVLSLFIMSAVPLAFADDNESENETSEEEDERVLPRAREVVRKDEVRARVIERTQKAADRIAEVRARIQTSRADFLDARAKIKARGRDASPADKKEFLLSASDRILDLLAKLYERVNASDAEDKEALLEEIQDAIDAVSAAKAKVEALNESSTREEIRAAVKELREAWKDAEKLLKKGAHRVVHKRVGLVVQRMEHLARKLARMLEHLEEKGLDVGVAADLKVKFDAELDSAQDHLDKARELFDAGSVPESNEEIRLAHADLKEAHGLLKDILKAIRATRPGALEEAEEEAEEEEESEEESEDEEEDEEESEDESEDEPDESDDNETENQTGA